VPFRVKPLVNRVLEWMLAPTGYMLTRRAGLRSHGMARALQLVAERGHALGTVIDVGASNGSWSLLLMDHFPRSQYLLFEPQDAHVAALVQLARERPNVHTVKAAAGEAPGEIHFNAADPFGGQASKTPYAEHDVTVPVATIDDEVHRRGLPGPYLLKLDTHGFEMPILRGAQRTLEQTEIIVMECYNFRIAPECLTFDEMCAHLRTLGFRCIDLADPLYRPGDQVLWQMDLVFARQTRPEFARASYS
jgi:FkbM family methyltransferase